MEIAWDMRNLKIQTFLGLLEGEICHWRMAGSPVRLCASFAQTFAQTCYSRASDMQTLIAPMLQSEIVWGNLWNFLNFILKLGEFLNFHHNHTETCKEQHINARTNNKFLCYQISNSPPAPNSSYLFSCLSIPDFSVWSFVCFVENWKKKGKNIGESSQLRQRIWEQKKSTMKNR